MAITRTAWTDLTTIINNSEKTTLYNQIDDATEHPRCNVEHSTTQSLTTATFTAVQLDTDDVDAFAMHDPASNNTRVTIPTGYDGYYEFTGYALFAANATGVRALKFRKNGTTFLGPQAGVANAGGGEAVGVLVRTGAELVAGDYLELLAYQNSGGNLNIGSATEELKSRVLATRITK